MTAGASFADTVIDLDDLIVYIYLRLLCIIDMSLLPFDDEPGRGFEESDSEIWEWSVSDMVVIYIAAFTCGVP